MNDHDQLGLDDFSAEARADRLEAELKALLEQQEAQAVEAREQQAAEAVEAREQHMLDLIEQLRGEVRQAQAKVGELLQLEQEQQSLRTGAASQSARALKELIALRNRVGRLETGQASLNVHTKINPQAPASQLVTASGVVAVPLPDGEASVSRLPGGVPGAPQMKVPAGIVGGLFVLYLALKELSTLFGLIK